MTDMMHRPPGHDGDTNPQTDNGEDLRATIIPTDEELAQLAAQRDEQSRQSADTQTFFDPETSTPEVDGEPIPRRLSRRRLLGGALAAVVAAGAGGTIYGLTRDKKPTSAAGPQPTPNPTPLASEKPLPTEAQLERKGLVPIYAKGPKAQIMNPEWYSYGARFGQEANVLTTESNKYVSVPNATYALNAILNNLTYAVETDNADWNQRGLHTALEQLPSGAFTPEMQKLVTQYEEAREASKAKRGSDPNARISKTYVNEILAIQPALRDPSKIDMSVTITTERDSFDGKNREYVTYPAEITLANSETHGWSDGGTNKMWVFSELHFGDVITSGVANSDSSTQPN